MSTFSVTIQRLEVSEDTSNAGTLREVITDTALLETVFPTDSSGQATSVELAFDRNVSRQTTQRILTATFGDGYEQRVGNGINIKQENIGVAFANRAPQEISVLSTFLNNKAGANFDIIINGETIKVACENYTTTYVNTSSHTLNTTFRRVYEP